MSQFRKTLFSTTIALMFFAMLFTAVGADSAEALTLRFALITPETFPYYDGALKFKEEVEALSGGDITVQVYPGGQLGAEREINEQILEGTIHIGVGAGALANISPVYNIVQMPFLVQGQDHMEAIAEGPVGAELARRIEQEGGYRVVGWFSTGDSAIETLGFPVRTPADLSGRRIRVIENPVLVDTFRALGANPTPMPYTEIYTGLAQGIIEGAHLDIMSVMSLHAYELIDHMTDVNQITFLSEPRPVIMSADFFDNLSDQQQEWIMTAMQRAAQYERDTFRAKMNEAIEHMRDVGVQFTRIEVDAFLDAVRPVWEEYAEKLDAQDLLADIVALAE